MRDIHCHILPGVDDGAADLDESLAMLEAAKRAGVTRIVCTPHCRDPYFDYDKMWDAFELLRDNADGFPLQMGFEVNHRKLVELGIDAAEHLHFDGTNEFLLELSTHADAYAFREYENTIYDLQCRGYQVIIAHPERYRAVQKDVSVAERLVDMGCKLQASATLLPAVALVARKSRHSACSIRTCTASSRAMPITWVITIAWRRLARSLACAELIFVKICP